MDEKKWDEQYTVRLIRIANLTRMEATDCLEAGRGEYDYDDDPQASADEEMSYWTDDA